MMLNLKKEAGRNILCLFFDLYLIQVLADHGMWLAHAGTRFLKENQTLLSRVVAF
jgi:hypothetical protein